MVQITAVSDLTATDSASASDQVYAVVGGNSRSITIGNLRSALHPVSFLRKADGSQTNVTGNGTVATVSFQDSIFDAGSDTTATTFTAPATAKYWLCAMVSVSGLVSASDILVDINTSNRTYQPSVIEAPPNGTTHVVVTALADMDESDTAIVRCRVQGMAGDTVDIVGNASILVTYFCGYLAV